MNFAADIKPLGVNMTFSWDGEKTVEVTKTDGDQLLDRFEVRPDPERPQIVSLGSVLFEDVLRAIESYLSDGAWEGQALGEIGPDDLPFVRLGLSGPDDVIRQLRPIAKEFRHCGDYGHTFFNVDSGLALFVGGDSDGQPEYGYTSFEEIEERLKAIEGVNEVRFEAEWLPQGADFDVVRAADAGEAEGWVYVATGREHYDPNLY